MTTEARKDPRKNFVPRYLPWLLALARLGVYGATLNPWVSRLNLDYVARVSGWTWQPDLYKPLAWLATGLLRWLPTGWIPLALNFFSAACAAVTLGFLARSVVLLPQDRTEPQRLREKSDYSFLTARGAWLPPVLAVLICGLQFTFWENATNFTAQSLDLLIFAFTVWALLEYRLDEREGRLWLAMFIYGAGMTEDFGLIGLLPLLVGSLIWIRGLSFFNAGFLGRMILFGLAGTSLYLLLPTVGLISGKIPAEYWWTALKFNLSQQWQVVGLFFTSGDFRRHLALISLTTLLPAFLPAMRWRTSGDNSPLGSAVTALMFHVVHAVLLGICLWGMFDPPFSARHLGANYPFLSFLSLYYLAALSAGYYCGYFLVVTLPAPARRGSRRRPSGFKRALQPAALTVLVALTGLAAAGLIYKNRPAVRALNNDTLKQYARLLAASLPPTGGLVLSDSDTTADIPFRLYLLQEVLAQAGRATEYVPVDTKALKNPEYHRFLHRRYPTKWPLLVDPKAKYELDDHGLLGMIQLLSKTNAIYYLHPSFGYYFELFYPEAHGLVYQLKPLPTDTLLPRPPDIRLRGENEAFWARAEAGVLAPIIQELTPPNAYARPVGLADKLMARLHISPEPNLNAQLAGRYYSRGLNFWAVQEQRANELKAAAADFTIAQKLNPDNLVAGINLEFNQTLQAHRPVTVDVSRANPDQFGKYRSWSEIITANGPFDEPGFCYEDGEIYLRGNYLRQALASFTRVHELAPNHLPTLLSLAELYDFLRQPNRALALLAEPLAHPAAFALDDNNSTELNIVTAAAYFQQTNLTRGVRLIETEIAHHPGDNNLFTAAVQAYLAQGLLTNALQVIQLKLAQTPDDPAWLFREGYTYMRMADYPRAVASLTRVLTLQPGNYDALFNRAVASLNSGQLEAARNDYLQLQKIYPKAFQVSYGLGDIAWRLHDTNAAIQNYTACLANAPTNLAESTLIRQHLADLKAPAH